MSGRTPIIVIGGGVCGLSAAYHLARRMPPDRFSIRVLESSPTPGGLAGPTTIGNIEVDRFYHFLLKPDRFYVDLLNELGLGHRLGWRRSRMAFFRQGRLVPFGTPLSLLLYPDMRLHHKIRYGFQVLHARYRRDWENLENQTAVNWLIRNFGKEGYTEWWRQLMEMKFRDHADEICAAWVWARILRNARSRHGIFTERAGYLRGGTKIFIEGLLRALHQRNVEIATNCTVRRILFNGGGEVRGVRTDSETLEASVVIYAAPLVRLTGMLDFQVPKEYGRCLSGLENIGITCTLILLDRPLTQVFWLNISDATIQHAGIIEFTNLHRDPELEGGSLLYIPEYGDFESERGEAGPDERLRQIIPILKRINPLFERRWVRDVVVTRAPHAQPICRRGFSKEMPHIRTPLAGLWAADSTHILPDDRTISASLSLGADMAEDVLRCVVPDPGAPLTRSWTSSPLWTPHTP